MLIRHKLSLFNEAINKYNAKRMPHKIQHTLRNVEPTHNKETDKNTQNKFDTTRKKQNDRLKQLRVTLGE